MQTLDPEKKKPHFLLSSLHWIGTSIFFTLLACLYLWPAPEDVLLHGRVMGPGHDETLMPLYMAWVRQLFFDNPTSLLNGAVWLPQLSAPVGALGWIPYIERLAAIITLPFSSSEQAPFFSMLLIFILNGVSGTLLGRLMRLNMPLSLAMGTCLAFTPFTLWRSKVHPALAGIYVLTLLGIYFHSIQKTDSWKKIGTPVLILLLTLSSAHYLVFVILTALPVIVFYSWKNLHKNQRKFLAISLIPFCVGLIWIKKGTVIGAYADRPALSQTRTPLPADPNKSWGLIAFAARPLDYFSGYHDPAATDINPLRKKLTTYLSQKELPFHPEERSSGIRWLIWLGLILALLRWKSIPPELKLWAKLGLALAIVSYWCSLSSRSIAPLGIGMGPSRWIHALIPEMRSPNRWSTGVNLGVTMVAFIFFSTWLQRWSRNRSAWASTIASLTLLALVVLEFPPTWAHPTREIEPRLIPLSSPCGRGVFLPYYSADDTRSYHAILRLRGTDCEALNMQNHIPTDRALKKIFNEDLARDWKKAAQILECQQVQWVVFDTGSLPQNTCQKLGLKEKETGVCQRESPDPKTIDLKKCPTIE